MANANQAENFDETEYRAATETDPVELVAYVLGRYSYSARILHVILLRRTALLLDDNGEREKSGPYECRRAVEAARNRPDVPKRARVRFSQKKTA